jgi:hypothetical protein
VLGEGVQRRLQDVVVVAYAWPAACLSSITGWYRHDGKTTTFLTRGEK